MAPDSRKPPRFYLPQFVGRAIASSFKPLSSPASATPRGAAAHLNNWRAKHAGAARGKGTQVAGSCAVDVMVCRRNGTLYGRSKPSAGTGPGKFLSSKRKTSTGTIFVVASAGEDVAFTPGSPSLALLAQGSPGMTSKFTTEHAIDLPANGRGEELRYAAHHLEHERKNRA